MSSTDSDNAFCTKTVNTVNITCRYNVKQKFQQNTIEDNKCIYEMMSVPIEVACINLEHNLNVGTLVRTASLFAVSKIHIIGKKKYDRRGAVGLQNYIPVIHHSAITHDENGVVDDDKMIDILKTISHDHFLVFIEQTKQSINLINMNKIITSQSKSPLFIVGSESCGISQKIIEYFSKSSDVIFIEIPQGGIGRSHNVTCALSIVLWEYFRQKTTFHQTF